MDEMAGWNPYAPAIAFNQQTAQKRAMMAARLMQAAGAAPPGQQAQGGTAGGADPAVSGASAAGGLDFSSIARAFGRKETGGFSDPKGLADKPEAQGAWGGLLDTMGGWFGTPKT